MQSPVDQTALPNMTNTTIIRPHRPELFSILKDNQIYNITRDVEIHLTRLDRVALFDGLNEEEINIVLERKESS